MKKLYQSERWKEYSLRASQKQLRRDQRKKLKRKKRIRQKARKENDFGVRPAAYLTKKRHGRIEIPAPSNFSLITNTDETIAFFTEIDDCINHHRNIFFDLSGVKEITSDAILYLLSRIDYKRTHFHGFQLSGNEPTDECCKQIFQTSGFYNYVYAVHPSLKKADPNVFSIKSDRLADGSKAKEVCEFTRKCLGLSDTKDIYVNIIECMGNTKNHAYKLTDIYKKWWLMASYHPELNKLRYTFVDNGDGIPATIRKKWHERVQQLTSVLLGDSVGRLKDSILIESALKGEFRRTQTGLPHRGKGLPKMYKTAKNKKLDNLIIISKRGYVNCSTDTMEELRGRFHGTLLSWEFSQTPTDLISKGV